MDFEPDCVSELVTATVTAPAEPEGETHVIDVVFETLGEVQVDPATVTVAPERNPVPVIVMVVLPAVEMVDGETDVTVGAGL